MKLPCKIPNLRSIQSACVVFALTQCLLPFPAWTDDFQDGLKAYETGNYDAASESFEKTAHLNETAAARHNLALSAYQSGQLANAVWQLERALRIEPHNKEYRFKLSSLRQQIGLPHGQPSWPNVAANTLSVPQWGGLATIALWGGLAAWVFPLALRHKPGLGLKAVRILSLLFLAATVPALEFHRRAANEGVIISEQSVELRAAPANAAPQTGLARPGERIRILDSHGDFDKIRTEGAASGWLPKEAFRRIRLGDA